MKIRAIDISRLDVATPPPRNTYYPNNSYVVVRVKTDEGIEGLGYTMLVGGNGASSVQAYLKDNLAPLLEGEDPTHTGRLWQKMYDADRGIRKKGIPMYALSAVDIALWDIVGKSVQRPLWQLWGAVSDKVPVYGGGGFLSYSVDDIVKEAEATFAIGAKHYKMKVGLAPLPDLMANVKRVAAVRKAIGDAPRLLVDVNQRLDVHSNVRLANAIEPCDIFWYEEPVYADNIGQCAEVARRINIPVATGENEYTRYGFRDLVEQKAASILNPDIMRCGGFSELLKISHLAAAYDIGIAPHLAPELSIHVLAAIPNATLLEWSITRTRVWQEEPVVDNGFLRVPHRPGHGMEFSEEALAKYRVK
ncbi:MAG TPA: mandelate racemase/muconate lactonizing enzyme family protein [Burkholderiales bacterium]|nr:mandelate racemase/muconate lactonizing enzyme family protein [Burkholderiales bacterium]